MTIDEHKEITRYYWNNQDKEKNILHATLIITSEAGELADTIKKKIGYGKDYDITNIKEEVGDIVYGLQRLMTEFELTWEDVLNANVNKLKVRYVDGFSQNEAINRNLSNERIALEK